MSTENPLFEAFKPQQPEGATPANAVEQTGKKKRKTKTAKAPKEPKPEKAAKPEKPPRKKREAKPRLAATPKYTLAKIMAATAGLKEADVKLFEALLANLHALNKATRARILTAVGKVFA